MFGFVQKVQARRAGIVSYGLTPPRAANAPEKLAEVAERQRARIASLPVDAVILYDLQDESSREASPRPFPFLPTLDAASYAERHLAELERDVIVYRAVGNHSERSFSDWLAHADRASRPAGVTFVGSPKRGAPEQLGLPRAYELYNERCRRLLLGGICIAERHSSKHDEHLRMLAKQAAGCSFFVSQAVYDPAAMLRLIDDLAAAQRERGKSPCPLLVTLTPCGSEQTLAFLKWLGISVAPELEQRLRASRDMLNESLTICQDLIRELRQRAASSVPLGFNVESVSIRKQEIEAASELVRFAAAELARG